MMTTALLADADACWTAQDWSGAADRLARALEQDRPGAEAQGVPLQLAQCRIEAADPAALDAIDLPRGARAGTEREHTVIQRTRVRAVALCRAGEFERASRVLQVLSDYDAAIADARADMLARGSRRDRRAAYGAPTFTDDPTLSSAAVERTKQQFAGMRVLIVVRQLFGDRPERRHDASDNLLRAARRFGLVPQVVNSHYPPPGVGVGGYVAWLQEQILAFKPQLILYDDLFESGLSAYDAETSTQLGMVLQGVRAHLGVRVVKFLFDAWMVLQHGPDRPLRGIGTSFDLLQHIHPSLHHAQAAIERAHSFCYPLPYALPRPTVPWGTVPRACFAGSISWFNVARVAWWAELGRRGAPFDFLQTDHEAAVQRSDQDYANIFHGHQLAVSFTRRANGARIVPGRSIEIPLSGGVLLDEASANGAYFLAPGTHCETFETLDQLQGLIDDLLRSEARRRALAREGEQWTTEHFTGDRFWAGLLARLFS